MSLVQHVLLLAQPAATAMGGGGGGGAPASCEQGLMSQLPMLLLLVGLMYFLLIRPQQQQEKAHKAMLAKLKPGDVVRTDSGIRGEIVKLTDTDAELLVAERTKITIHRRRIAGAETAGDAATKTKE